MIFIFHWQWKKSSVHTPRKLSSVGRTDRCDQYLTHSKSFAVNSLIQRGMWYVGNTCIRRQNSVINISNCLCTAHWIVDTIPGRQCMASCFVVLKQFPDAMVYLNSIKVAESAMKWCHMCFALLLFTFQTESQFLSHWYVKPVTHKYENVSWQHKGTF